MATSLTSASSSPSRFWRVEDPVLDESGAIVRGGMWPAQRRWWTLPNFVKAFVGGFGAGKTIVGCKRAIALALHNAPVPTAMVSPTFPIARETTILTTSELLQGKQTILGRDEFDWHYNKSSHVFRVRYRDRIGRIIILTGENPLSLRGPNIGSALIDEPFIQAEEVFQQMVARVRHPAARWKEIGLLGTPEELNWGYDLCVGEYAGQTDVGLVTASTRENLALGADYVKRLESTFDERAALAYIEGQFVSLSTGLVYYAFDPQENIVEREVPSGAEFGCGMDFNVNPMAACVFWRAGPTIHFFDEIELPNADTEYLCGELHDRGYYRRGLRAIYPDASGSARHTSAPGGKSDFHYIKEAGFEVHAPRANPPRRDRYNAVNGKLKPRDGRISLTISPRCRKLRKYLSLYSHANMNKADQVAMSHLLDAFSYPISYLYPVAGARGRAVRTKGY